MANFLGTKNRFGTDIHTYAFIWSTFVILIDSLTLLHRLSQICL